MPDCEDFCLLEPVHASLDRLLEGHYWLHQMEDTYHSPEAFRFSTYAAIRVLADTFKITYSECVRYSKDRDTFRELYKQLKKNVLAKSILKCRDRLSHEGNLSFSDSLAIGNGSLRAVRNSFPVASDVGVSTRELCSSQASANIFADEDFLNIGFRKWFVDEIDPQSEIVEVMAEHWLSLAGFVTRTLELLNLQTSLPTFDLECRKVADNDFRICRY